MRSWVSGRGGTTPCCAKAMAVASTAPIQMGRYRSPDTSLSSTMGWLLGISTRTPITSTSRTRSEYSRTTPDPVGASGAECGLHEGRVQPHRQCGHLGDRLLGAGGRADVAATPDRRDHLLHEPDLPVRRGLEGAQVPGLQAEDGELAGGLGDHQRVPVV